MHNIYIFNHHFIRLIGLYIFHSQLTVKAFCVHIFHMQHIYIVSNWSILSHHVSYQHTHFGSINRVDFASPPIAPSRPNTHPNHKMSQPIDDENASVTRLIRELHAPDRNVCRRPLLLGGPLDAPDQPIDVTTPSPSPSPTPNTFRHKFLESLKADHRTPRTRHHSDVGLHPGTAIPSLIVTGTNGDPLRRSPDASGQRRFSQFYLAGLRRFSSSNTVLISLSLSFSNTASTAVAACCYGTVIHRGLRKKNPFFWSCKQFGCCFLRLFFLRWVLRSSICFSFCAS